MRKIILLLITIPSICLSQKFWEQTNGPYGGAIWSTAIDLDGNIWAGTSNGIFRSTNNGENWSRIILGPAFTPVRSFAFNPNGQMYFAGWYVYKSIDKGMHWNQLDHNKVQGIICLTINSNGDIFAGSSNGEGVFRSADNGENWMKTNSGFPQQIYIYSLVIDHNQNIYAGTNEGIFKSTDNGNNWTKIYNSNQDFILSLAINSNGDIFVAKFKTILKSTNKGVSWVVINTTASAVNSITIDSMGRIFAGTDNGICKSDDNGENWTLINGGLTNTDVLSLSANANNDIFAGTYGGGIFCFTKHSSNWIEKNMGLTANNITSLVINSGGYIFAADQNGGGIFRSSDNGNTWKKSLNSALVFRLLINSSGDIFAGAWASGLFGPGYHAGGIYRSTDNGETWSLVNNGLTYDFIQSLAINSSGHLFAGTDVGVFRSINNGNSWSLKTNGLPNNRIQALAVNSNGEILAGTEGAGIYLSKDNGESWASSNNGLTFGNINSLIISSKGYVYAGTRWFGPGIFRSTNNGSYWTLINTGLPPVFTASTFSINSLGYIYVGGAEIPGGVYVSRNDGNNWTKITNGLSVEQVGSLAIASNDYIFAGTDGGGVYRSINTSTSKAYNDKFIPATFILMQNYPNPFNPSTSISYEVPRSSFVTLEVYDVLGRKMSTLVQEEKATGKYSIRFNADGLASGIYFYTLRADDFIQTNKMTLIK
ncbi:MAG: T9SS type A sorting domain-containing protein [Bacteroidetes bacterium]|nr:T9SS type A sorting domain-containing protein [Bacteroidota bacterium]